MSYLKCEDDRKVYPQDLSVEEIMEQRLKGVDPSRREEIKGRYDQYCMYKDLKKNAKIPMYGGLIISAICSLPIGLYSIVNPFFGGEPIPLELYYGGLFPGLTISAIGGVLYSIDSIQCSRLKKQIKQSK